MKYERQFGPQLWRCALLLRDVSANAWNDITNLLRWQVFNLYAGNADGHAKNLSILYRRSGEVRLAPFYDLVLTRAYSARGGLDEETAFSIAGRHSPDSVGEEQWQELIRQCRLPVDAAMDVIRKAAAAVVPSFRQARQEFESLYGPLPGTPDSVALDEVEAAIERDCRFIPRQRHG